MKDKLTEKIMLKTQGLSFCWHYVSLIPDAQEGSVIISYRSVTLYFFQHLAIRFANLQKMNINFEDQQSYSPLIEQTTESGSKYEQ